MPCDEECYEGHHCPAEPIDIPLWAKILVLISVAGVALSVFLGAA